MLLDNMNDTNLSILVLNALFKDKDDIVRKCIMAEYEKRLSVLYFDKSGRTYRACPDYMFYKSRANKIKVR